MLGHLASTKGILPNTARAALQMLQLRTNGLSESLDRMESHLDDILKDNRGSRRQNLLFLSEGIKEYSGTKESMAYVRQCVALVRPYVLSAPQY